jgi:lysozyme family protein
VSRFEDAIGTILKHEGGWANNPNDPGGATKYGVSLRYLKTLGHDIADIDHDGDVDVDDVKNMTVQQAMDIYHTEWWNRNHYSDLSFQPVATKVFDMAVNMGSKQAHKIVQRVFNNWPYQNAPLLRHPLVVDGILGPASIDSVNRVNGAQFLDGLREACRLFYLSLVDEHPKLTEFLTGWMRRADS